MNRSSRSASLGGDALEAAHAVGGLAAVQRLDAAEVDDLAEQLDQVVGRVGRLQRAHQQFQFTPALAPRGFRMRLRLRLRLGCRGGRRGRQLRRLPGEQRTQASQQFGGVDDFAVAAVLVPRQLRLQGIAGLQQHVDHGPGGREFVAPQLVQQRLHLVRQLGHVVEAEGGRAALDRVRAAEDRVQRLVVGRLDVDLQQFLLHAFEVLAGFLEEHLVELAQVDAGAGAGALRCDVAHDVLSVVSGWVWAFSAPLS